MAAACVPAGRERNASERPVLLLSRDTLSRLLARFGVCLSANFSDGFGRAFSARFTATGNDEDDASTASRVAVFTVLPAFDDFPAFTVVIGLADLVVLVDVDGPFVVTFDNAFKGAVARGFSARFTDTSIGDLIGAFAAFFDRACSATAPAAARVDGTTAFERRAERTDAPRFDDTGMAVAGFGLGPFLTMPASVRFTARSTPPRVSRKAIRTRAATSARKSGDS